MKLHGYFRSSASYRVRIALNLKGLTTEHLPHHLRKGEQCAPAYLAINPQGLVPTLENDAGAILTQSLAIIEWLAKQRRRRLRLAAARARCDETAARESIAGRCKGMLKRSLKFEWNPVSNARAAASGTSQTWTSLPAAGKATSRTAKSAASPTSFISNTNPRLKNS